MSTQKHPNILLSTQLRPLAVITNTEKVWHPSTFYRSGVDADAEILLSITNDLPLWYANAKTAETQYKKRVYIAAPDEISSYVESLTLSIKDVVWYIERCKGYLDVIMHAEFPKEGMQAYLARIRSNNSVKMFVSAQGTTYMHEIRVPVAEVKMYADTMVASNFNETTPSIRTVLIDVVDDIEPVLVHLLSQLGITSQDEMSARLLTSALHVKQEEQRKAQNQKGCA